MEDNWVGNLVDNWMGNRVGNSMGNWVDSVGHWVGNRHDVNWGWVGKNSMMKCWGGMDYWCVDNCWPVVWLMYSVGYNWSMSMLDGSMTGNIGSGNSQDGRKCDEGLKNMQKTKVMSL